MSSEVTSWYPYIRGTNKKYGTEENGGFWGENGYNLIECGYINVSSGEVRDIKLITTFCDVVDFYEIIHESRVNGIAIDCVGEGYLRIFSRDHTMPDLRWESEELPLSNMTLSAGKPNFLSENETTNE